MGAAGPLFRPGTRAVALRPAAAGECLEELAAITAERVLGSPAQEWLDRVETADDLIDWAGRARTTAARLLRRVLDDDWAALGRSRVSPLPPLSAADLEAMLGGDAAGELVAAPLWEGAPAETSPYTRNRGDTAVTGLGIRFGNGLLPRLAAQLVEVAALHRGLRGALAGPSAEPPSLAASPGEGVGIAQVQAARGLLVHRVETDGERIRDYRILAPTEWNFHPRGVVARGLAALEPGDDETLRRQTGLFVTAVDPCVEYDVTIL
jgi:hypothetical protein